MSENIDVTYANYLTRTFDEHVAQIVRDLRKLADRVEREAADRRPSVMGDVGNVHATYGRVTYRILHEITWAIANLGLDKLAENAAESDVAAAAVSRTEDSSKSL